MLRIGIDLGGTKIEGIVADDDLNDVVRRRIPTRQSEGYQAIITRLADFITQLEEEAGTSCPVGICTPGSISPRSRLMRNSNTVCLNGRPLKTDLEQALGRAVAMENDANCFALAEALLGAGRGYGCVFGVIMGTGVGGGIVINKRVVSGRLLIAGEWGHQKLYPDGNPCYCGQKGCVETYLSGPALERRWSDLGGPSLSLPEIVARVEADSEDARAQSWKGAFLNDFGLALSNVVNVLDPDAVVLGGGVSNISFLYDEGLGTLREYVFSDYCDTPVKENELGDSSGVFGAACLTLADQEGESETGQHLANSESSPERMGSRGDRTR
ncbi:MAG TPA: ROK family protein [Acidobacteriota bacterium]|nr:ROK family protein [Acidobacteriota bacterium]